MLLLWSVPVQAQEYPRWFLRQGDILPAACAAGYALAGLYVDTTGGPAFRNGVENFVKFQACAFTGSEAFWTAEFGTMVMGSTVTEDYDTAAVERSVSFLKPLHQHKTQKMSLVLVGESGMAIPPGACDQVNIRTVPRPSWIERPPASPTHLYAVGMAAEYFYESSSWLMAEYTARRELARSLSTVLKAVQRTSTVGHEVRDETVTCNLTEVRVMERWKDPMKRIHYVLVRMLKPRPEN